MTLADTYINALIADATYAKNLVDWDDGSKAIIVNAKHSANDGADERRRRVA